MLLDVMPIVSTTPSMRRARSGQEQVSALERSMAPAGGESVKAWSEHLQRRPFVLGNHNQPHQVQPSLMYHIRHDNSFKWVQKWPCTATKVMPSMTLLKL